MEKIIKKRSWIEEVEEDYNGTVNKIIEKTNNGKLKKIKTIKVSGFDVEVEKKEETKKVNSELIKKKNEMEKFRNKLKTKGINSVAVLPKNVFEKMISGFPFYTFKEFNEKGEVKGNLENLVQDVKEDTISILSYTSFFVSLVSFIILSFYLLSIIPIVFFLIRFFVLDISAKNNLDKLFIASSLIMFPLISIILLFIENIQPKINTKKKLWPEKVDAGDDWIKIILPKAPKGVVDKLLKCHENNIKTYLVIHEKGFGIETKELVKKAKIKYDPIICTDSSCGNYVAIIDQFGDIPEEKRLIKKIKKQFKSITEELSLKHVDNLN